MKRKKNSSQQIQHSQTKFWSLWLNCAWISGTVVCNAMKELDIMAGCQMPNAKCQCQCQCQCAGTCTSPKRGKCCKTMLYACPWKQNWVFGHFLFGFFWSFGVKMWWGTIGIAENGTMMVTLISTIWDHYKAHEEQSCVLSLSVASQDWLNIPPKK